MKREKEKTNFKIDLLNLEKLSEDSMKHIQGANVTECECVVKHEELQETIMTYMQHIDL